MHTSSSATSPRAIFGRFSDYAMTEQAEQAERPGRGHRTERSSRLERPSLSSRAPFRAVSPENTPAPGRQQRLLSADSVSWSQGTTQAFAAKLQAPPSTVRGPASNPPSVPPSEAGSSPRSPVCRSPQMAPRRQRYPSGEEKATAVSLPCNASVERESPPLERRGRNERRQQRPGQGSKNDPLTYDRFDNELSTMRRSLTNEQRQQIAMGLVAAIPGSLRAQSPVGLTG